jgi:hypothetical protein
MSLIPVLDWVWFLTKYAALAVPPAALLWLINRLTAHSLFLYAQRTSRPDDPILGYRLAIQNNEDVSLRNHALVITILDQEGRFVDGPDVYKGLSIVTPKMDDACRTWTMSFVELPPYDTWTIDCRTTSQARHIRVEVPESETTLSGNRLQLTAGQNSVLTGRTTTEWWWCGLSIVLGLMVYAGVVWRQPGGFHEQDAWFVSTIMAFTFGLFCCSRIFGTRMAPPVTQGYWEVAHTDPRAPADK